MCGIIGYFGKKPTRVKNLLDMAYWNIHRGDDGIGIIIPSNETKSHIRMWKLGFRIEEILTHTLGKDRAVKFMKVGSIGMNSLDERKYKRLNKEFTPYAKSITNTMSNKILLHHRSASTGEVESKNIHPIVIENNYFFHNGTSYPAIYLRSYQEIFENEKFASSTDTEVISKTYLRLLDRFKELEKIPKFLHNIFGSIGVIIRINNINKIFEIIKDNSRPLWLVELKNGSYLLLSEPTPHIAKQLSRIYRLGDGVIKSGESVLVKEYTEDFKEAYELWEADLSNNEIKPNSCDCCKEEKMVRRFTSLDKYFDSVVHDRCFVCTIRKIERTEKNWSYGNEHNGDEKEWQEITFPELSFD